MRKERFDPTELVTLARQQQPESPWLAEALACCLVAWRENRAYVYFIDPDGSPERLQSYDTVVLEHPKKGDIVLDVSQEGRIIGAEFVYRL